MKTINIILVCMALGSAALAQNISDPKEVMKKSRDQSKLSGMEAKTTLEINDGKGNQRIRETTMVSRIFPDGTEKRTILFLSPTDVKGTGILIYDYEGKDDNMWIYMPALRKSRKIVSSEKSRNFMGSEFSNSDLTVGNLDDFSYAMDGTEMVDQQACWKIKVTPATSNIATDYGISSKTVWISQKDFMPRKTVFMDPEGKPWKELTYSGIKMMDPKSGKYFISQMEIKNLKNGRFSKMNMTQMSFNPAVKEEYFTLSYIEKQ
ncbi:MAG: outer membrane lipoprotein-sorting protein [Porphyromonadaceae bacterium]|nr:MAG: outer membrane lipoprotein-sorting protein [Porphyromonadaceae bacterium]